MNIAPIIVCICFLMGGILLFAWAYNSPMFVENVCRDAKLSFGVETRVVIDQLSNGYCQVKIDGNWIDICDSNVGYYCTALN